jgi:hypothetical protein
MWFPAWAGPRRPASPRRRPPGPRTRCACRPRARTRPSAEALEDRSLPSGTPLPIPGVLFPAAPGGNPFGGPAVHFGLPGPADNTVPTLPRVIGGEPSTITDFNGFVGVAHVEGTGTDNHGNTLFWDVDLRFMDGVFRGDDGRVHQGTFAEV